MRITLLSAARHVLGIESAALASELSALAARSHHRRVRQVHARWPLPDWLPTRSRRQYLRLNSEIDALVLELIQRRRAAGGEQFDLLSTLLRSPGLDGRPMSDRQIRDEICTLFPATMDGVARTLAWALWEVSRHPEVESRLCAELQAALGTREIADDDVPRLTYAAAVFNEALRLYPHGWLLARRALGADRLPSGAAIPPGARLYVSPLTMHRDPRYFADPERFDPQRFIGDGPRPWPPHAFLPFGLGPRNCLGENFSRFQATIVLATLLARYEFRVEPGMTIVPETANGTSLQPSGDRILVRVARR
jgi:cytochrome P450